MQEQITTLRCLTFVTYVNIFMFSVLELFEIQKCRSSIQSICIVYLRYKNPTSIEASVTTLSECEDHKKQSENSQILRRSRKAVESHATQDHRNNNSTVTLIILVKTITHNQDSHLAEMPLKKQQNSNRFPSWNNDAFGSNRYNCINLRNGSNNNRYFRIIEYDIVCMYLM